MANRRRRKAGRRKTDKRSTGWLYMLFGLFLGLAVAAAIYVSGQRAPEPRPAMLPEPEPAPASKPAKTVKAEPPPAGAAEEAFGFDFYEMLPNLDVEVVTESARPKQEAPVATRVVTPGIYILQAGSFTKLADAQTREAQIALLGIRAEIKQGDVRGSTYYRVYTTDPLQRDEVNRVRTLLKSSGIETLAKRISD